MALLSDVRIKEKTSFQYYINACLSTMSGQAQIQFSLIKKIKIGCQEHMVTPSPHLASISAVQ